MRKQLLPGLLVAALVFMIGCSGGEKVEEKSAEVAKDAQVMDPSAGNAKQVDQRGTPPSRPAGEGRTGGAPPPMPGQ